MYIRFFLYMLVLLVGKVVAVILSPFIAMWVGKDGEVMAPFKWAVTHDASINEWWDGLYEVNHKLKKKYTQEDFDNKVWIRWFSRMKWIQRNPAYGLAHALGYSQKGMTITMHQDEGHLWDRGYDNRSFWTAVNEEGTKAFMFQWQWHYYKQKCLEVYLGWKLFRQDPDQKCMMSIRISPLREYEKLPV